jgi:hypothetical protein
MSESQLALVTSSLFDRLRGCVFLLKKSEDLSHDVLSSLASDSLL